jgi:hypothetical protein
MDRMKWTTLVISIHEAAHSVVGRMLGLHCGAATIVGAPRAYLRDDHNLPSLLTAMAGAAAEREMFGVAGGTDGDRPKIMRLLDALDLDSDTCWRVTRLLVELHHDRIVAVAEALRQHGELSGEEIDAIVRGEGG